MLRGSARTEKNFTFKDIVGFVAILRILLILTLLLRPDFEECSLEVTERAVDIVLRGRILCASLC